MLKTITFQEFKEEFKNNGYSHTFTDKGLYALYTYIEISDKNYVLDVDFLAMYYEEYTDIADYNNKNKTQHENIKQLTDDVIAVFGDSFIIDTY